VAGVHGRRTKASSSETPTLPQPADAAALLEKLARLRELRNPVRKDIEALRAGGRWAHRSSGGGVPRRGRRFELLRGLEEDLKFVMLHFRGFSRSHRVPAQIEVDAGRGARCEQRM